MLESFVTAAIDTARQCGCKLQVCRSVQRQEVNAHLSINVIEMIRLAHSRLESML
jgi:hypothetical protein